MPTSPEVATIKGIYAHCKKMYPELIGHHWMTYMDYVRRRVQLAFTYEPSQGRVYMCVLWSPDDVEWVSFDLDEPQFIKAWLVALLINRECEAGGPVIPYAPFDGFHWWQYQENSTTKVLVVANSNGYHVSTVLGAGFPTNLVSHRDSDNPDGINLLYLYISLAARGRDVQRRDC